jgi:hypothetical protein
VVELAGVEAQRPAHVAQRATGAVADHGGGQGGPAAAVFGVDVLDGVVSENGKNRTLRERSAFREGATR